MLLRFATFVVFLIAWLAGLQAQEPSTERRPIRLDDLFWSICDERIISLRNSTGSVASYGAIPTTGCGL